MRVLDHRKIQEVVKIQLHLEATRQEWNILVGLMAATLRLDGAEVVKFGERYSQDLSEMYTTIRGVTAI